MVNLRGSDLLWPSPARVVFPGNRNYRIEVGSKAEMILLVSLVSFNLVIFPVSNIGLRAGLQHLLGNFDMAYDTFIQGAGRHWYTLDMEATDNLTLQSVRCDCPIVGVWRRGLIVLEGDELRAVGASETAHNLYPISAKLIKGEPLQVISQRVDMRGRNLRWLLDQVDTRRTYYISGEVRVGSRMDRPVVDLQLYKPASFSGQVLQLHYARAQDLGRYMTMVGAEGELFVQYWMREGDPPLEVDIEEPANEDQIPPELRRFLNP